MVFEWRSLENGRSGKKHATSLQHVERELRGTGEGQHMVAVRAAFASVFPLRRIAVGNAMRQITYSLIGTLLGAAIVGYYASAWVDIKIREVSHLVDQKIDNVVNAPARAATNTWEAVRQAASEIW